MSIAVEASTEFNVFCDFVSLVRKAGCTAQTPERILEQFRGDREKWQRWYEGIIISEGQARRGEAKPLDTEAVLGRLRKRLADAGIGE
jgi:hypothetical protein